MRLQIVLAVATTTAAVSVQPAGPAAATGSSAALARHWLDLRRNEAAHQKDAQESVQLGYERIRELAEDSVRVRLVEAVLA